MYTYIYIYRTSIIYRGTTTLSFFFRFFRFFLFIFSPSFSPPYRSVHVSRPLPTPSHHFSPLRGEKETQNSRFNYVDRRIVRHS